MPFHRSRRWCLAEVETAEELGHKLVEQTWRCCAAYRITGGPSYFFLNDAISSDGAQEYAVVQRLEDGSYRQVESMTFSWSTVERSVELINEVLAGCYDDADYAYPTPVRIESPKEHGLCRHCA